MNAQLCEFGTCKRHQKVCVSMLNMETRETRKAHVCRDHLRDILSACERTNQLATITPLTTVAAIP